MDADGLSDGSYDVVGVSKRLDSLGIGRTMAPPGSRANIGDQSEKAFVPFYMGVRGPELNHCSSAMA